MTARIKGALRYSLLILITFVLLWLALGSIQVKEEESRFGFILAQWNKANKPFLVISGLLAIVSHLIRAERWKLLIRPTGHELKLYESFLSVMVGYFVNLAIPRGGEISRSYNLHRLNKTPIDVSFGTIVAERIVDLIILLLLIAISFLVQLEQLSTFFSQVEIPLDLQSWGLTGKLLIAVSALAALVIGYFLIMRFLRTRKKRLLVKGRAILRGIKVGLMTVITHDKKSLFYLYSILIWILYYLMSYSIVMAFQETSSLSMMDTLTIFVIGGIAMAVPLPGGTGSYHVLVPLGLVSLFGIGKDEAIAFSFIFHGWQTLVVIVIGVLSLLTSQYIVRKNKS